MKELTRMMPPLAPRPPSHLPSGRAWGKVILLGEHAVVYGVPALAVGIDRGAVAWVDACSSARSSPGSSDGSWAKQARPCRLYVEGWDVDVSEEQNDHDLGRAFRALLDAERAKGGQVSDLSIRACSELPPGGGLGCSAA